MTSHVERYFEWYIKSAARFHTKSKNGLHKNFELWCMQLNEQRHYDMYSCLLQELPWFFSRSYDKPEKMDCMRVRVWQLYILSPDKVS